MAVTKIWSIKGWIGKVVIYVETPDKTENPIHFKSSVKSDMEVQSLEDVMEFAMTDKRASDFEHVIEYAADGSKTEKQHYVSTLNCSPDNVRQSMMLTKHSHGKMDGITAFHGYQAFKPGEVTPDIAHEIGVRMAQELWGDRFEVVIATHLDRNHIHNHFVINSVSCIDGKKFYANKESYKLMREISDRLCNEYRLSVIENPQNGKVKQYAEWQANQSGKAGAAPIPTYRSEIKKDVDSAIKQSMTEKQFFTRLREMGYTIKFGSDITVTARGKERGIKLYRNFGEEYSIDGIRERILSQTYPQLPPPKSKPIVRHYKLIGDYKTTKKLTGLRALYFHYLYRMGILPRRKTQLQSPKRINILFREDLRNMDKIIKEVTLLCRNRIDTAEQLYLFKQGLIEEIAVLTNERRVLRNLERRISCEQVPEIKEKITALSKRLGELRKEVGLCEDITARSADMKLRIKSSQSGKTRKSLSKNGKENDHEPFGRRC